MLGIYRGVYLENQSPADPMQKPQSQPGAQQAIQPGFSEMPGVDGGPCELAQGRLEVCHHFPTGSDNQLELQ